MADLDQRNAVWFQKRWQSACDSLDRSEALRARLQRGFGFEVAHVGIERREGCIRYVGRIGNYKVEALVDAGCPIVAAEFDSIGDGVAGGVALGDVEGFGADVDGDGGRVAPFAQ